MAETNTTTQIVCCVCKESKALELFPKSPDGKNGRNTTCKACRSVYMKEYAAKNQQKLKEAAQKRYIEKKSEYQEKRKKHYQENKDHYKKKAKEWVEANPEKRKLIAKRWDRENPEKRSEIQKNNRLGNPGMYAAHFKARQQRKRQAMPSWADEESIKAMYRQSAWVTKITGIKHHVDHYYPLKSDIVCGLHNEFNLRIIPAKVNLRKHNHFPDQEAS